MWWNRNYSGLLIIMLVFWTATAMAQEPKGVVFGSILKRGEPFKHRMHLHSGAGMFFGAQPSGANGNYAFVDLPLGEYFAILGPLEEIPFSWRTEKFTLDKDNPVYYLEAADPFSVRLLFPTDGASFSPDQINENNPMIFRWTPYSELDETGESKAEYLLEIFSMDKKQYFKSPRLEATVFRFDGQFPDGSRLQLRPYQWRLTIYPKHSIWYGSSYVRDLLPGDLGEIHSYVGKYMTLEVPKWYDGTVEKFDLVTFLDIAYQIEHELSGVCPFQGKKGTIIYDPTINWAHSGLSVGLPIHFGKGWLVEGQAPWFGFFHEMGHDFQTGAIKNFSDLIVHQDTGVPIYSGLVEGFASLAYFYAAQVIQNRKAHGGITPAAYDAMMKDVQERRICYLNALDQYEQSGAPFNQINPDMVDGMLIQICEKYGWEKLPKFFRYFHDTGGIPKDLIQQANTHERRVTTIIAALSTALESDLHFQFRRWNFPIDEPFYDLIRQSMVQR
ncbi:MAG: hypothetical protein ONB05_00190 [candidate division KSB1 bacterium]|nr:hypothetical protein [candidate division KSB1 bacterium]